MHKSPKGATEKTNNSLSFQHLSANEGDTLCNILGLSIHESEISYQTFYPITEWNVNKKQEISLFTNCF